MEMDCMMFPESGKFRGIAILTFKTDAAAKRALAFDGADMGGFYLKVQLYKASRAHPKSDFAPEIKEGYNQIYIGNLSWGITEDDLRKLFSECRVSAIRLGMDKATGDFKGYAHVDFADDASLNTALKLDQKAVCGRPVRIRCAVPKRESETKTVVMKQPESGMKAMPNSVSRPAGGSSSSGQSKKKKRQTCYECGTPGHISADCPREKATEGGD